ncbi:MAG: DUF3566 domain-containing protein [Ilumatobacteraceae bacterium]|nr:DUF3566 domain-containing protein [Ilumatobacteraceae bacterium]
MSQDTEPVELAQALDRAARSARGSEPRVPERTVSAASPAGETGTASEVEERPFVLPEIVPATPDGPDDDRIARSRPAAPPVPEFPTVPVVEPAAPTVPAARTAPAEPSVPAADTPWPDVTSSPLVSSGTGVLVAAPTTVARAPGRRPRVRKVTRTLRHIDPWSTFKVALLFSAVLYGVLLTAGVLLWNVANETGTIDNVERWFTQFGWETFELDGGEIFSQAWVAGLFAAIGLTGFAVLSVTLFNLVSDIIGGVRMTVLEEEVVERRPVMLRRPVAPGRIVTDEQAGAFDLDGDLDDERAATVDAVDTSAMGETVEPVEEPRA